MGEAQLLERITLDPSVMVGKPVIRGTRLTVEYILNLLAHGATTKEIKDAAYKQGFFTLADDGVRHIIDGVTSIPEVARVADLTERMD